MPPGRLGDHHGGRLQERRERSRHSLAPRFRDRRCLVGSPSARARGWGVRPLETEPPELQFRSYSYVHSFCRRRRRNATRFCLRGRLFSAAVISGDAEAEAETESLGGGGSGRDWRID